MEQNIQRNIIGKCVKLNHPTVQDMISFDIILGFGNSAYQFVEWRVERQGFHFENIIIGGKWIIDVDFWGWFTACFGIWWKLKSYGSSWKRLRYSRRRSGNHFSCAGIEIKQTQTWTDPWMWGQNHRSDTNSIHLHKDKWLSCRRGEDSTLLLLAMQDGFSLVPTKN